MQVTTTVDALQDSPVLQRIDWKLKHGDGLVGWEGDPGMWLTAAQAMDETTGEPIADAPLLFEVWTRLENGQVVHVVSRPYLDDRLVVDVVRADTRRFDVAGDAMRRNQAVKDAAEKAMAEHHEHVADKLHFALLKGDGRKRLHPVGGTR